MNTLKKYAETAERVIGKRTDAKIAYDNEVLRWMHVTKDIGASVAKANSKHPSEALTEDKDELPNIKAYYDYLAVHGEIVRKLKMGVAQRK